MREKNNKKTYIRVIVAELTKENLLVSVESVDDEAKKLVNLNLECEGFNVSHPSVSH